MRKIKILAGAMALVSVLATGCHVGLEYEEKYCQDVETVYNSVDDMELNSPIVREEVFTDVTELGADGHCPGYDPSDSDG